jgi:serine/threonine protein kinase
MGAVYAARVTKLGRKVAIKLLYNDQPELTARFILEARTTARCNHENIIVIYEAGEHGGHPFMVLEHLQGAPLTRLIQEGRKLPPAQAVELIVPVVRALTVAHAHGIVHRDLKPDNIFVTDAGTIKVLDFGIAKLLQGKDEDGAARARGAGVRTPMPSAGVRRELTRRGAVIGTLPYMSPEQWAYIRRSVKGANYEHLLSRRTSRAVSWSRELQNGNLMSLLLRLFHQLGIARCEDPAKTLFTFRE